jgi:crotonobetainyl-CoA:carnitine CoA-transferase CaiB-like acyl-CoA transferase
MNVFENLKIIELCRVYSGPLCGMVLGDLGAEVIKVERPILGDESRSFGERDAEGRSCYFNSLNRNKTSLFLNLKNKEDQLKLKELIKTSDVLIHNWLQKSLDKLGFSYDEVREINPKLIYCVISGYGYNSSYKNKPSQDIIAQSISGLLTLTGEKDRLPMKTGIPVVDYATGMNAAFAIMSALYMRTVTGKGQLVHTSLLETAMSITSFEASKYLGTGIVPERNGNRHPAICPYNVYQCNDGLVTIAIANDPMWQRFCRALSIEYLLEDVKYDNNLHRLDHQDELEEILEKVIFEFGIKQLCDLLDEHHVSCSKINNIEEAFQDKAVKELNILKVLEDGTKVVGQSFHLEEVEEIYNKEPSKLC